MKYESIIAEAALVRSACMKLDSDKLKQLGDWAKMSTVLGGVSAVGGTVSAVAGFVGAKKAGEAVGTTEKLESAEALSAYESALIDAESAAAAGQVAAMRNSSEDSINLDAAACGNFSSDLYGSALDLVSRVKSDKVKEYKDLTDSDLVVMINLLNITYSPQPGNPEYEAKMLAEAKRLPDHPCGAFLMAKYAAVEPARDRLIGNMGGLSGGEDAKNAAKTAKTAGIFAGVGGAVSAVSSGVTAVSGAANWKNFESQIEAARNCRAAMESFDRKLEQFYNDKKKEKQDENKD
ncbi:MAG: hypothetical protein LBT92_02355 [Rickettsiales bacterium]|nr:hypothetical protein [Rickettsiales bacterium]